MRRMRCMSVVVLGSLSFALSALSAGCGDILGYQEVSYRTEPSLGADDPDARGSSPQSDASSPRADAVPEASQEPEEPDPPPTPCHATSEDGTCNIDCSQGKCADKRVMCPQGRPCAVHCSGAGCRWVGCPKGFPCTVECLGGLSCQDMVLRGKDASKLCLRCTTPSSNFAVCDRLTASLPVGGRSTCALYCDTAWSCGPEIGPVGDVGVCRREACVPW